MAITGSAVSVFSFSEPAPANAECRKKWPWMKSKMPPPLIVATITLTSGRVYRVCGVYRHGDTGVESEALKAQKWLARETELTHTRRGVTLTV